MYGRLANPEISLREYLQDLNYYKININKKLAQSKILVGILLT